MIADAERPTELRPVSRTEHEQHRAEQRSESRHHDRMHAGQAGLIEGAGRVAGALPFEGEIDGLRAATEFDGEACRRSECRHGSSEGYGRFARSLPSRTIRRPKLRPPVTIGASCQSSRRTLTPGSRRIRPAAPSCARSWSTANGPTRPPLDFNAFYRGSPKKHRRPRDFVNGTRTAVDKSI